MEDRVVEGAFTEAIAAAVTARGRRLSTTLVAELTQSALSGVFDLRQSVYRGHCEYLLRPRSGRHLAEDELDLRSHHFACIVGETPVAACRFSPCPGGRWEAHEHVALPPELAQEAALLVQISRVVVREEFRAHRFAEAVIWFACQHLARHTSFERYFALCLPPLVRYYRHFGATVVAGPDIRMPGRGVNRYRFIRGGLSETAATTRRYLEAATGDAGVAWELPAGGAFPAALRREPLGSDVPNEPGAPCKTS